MPLFCFVSFLSGHVTFSFPQELSVSLNHLNHLHCVHRALHAACTCQGFFHSGHWLHLSLVAARFPNAFLALLALLRCYLSQIPSRPSPTNSNSTPARSHILSTSSLNVHLFSLPAQHLHLAACPQADGSPITPPMPVACMVSYLDKAPGYHSASQGKEIKEGR